MIVFGLRNLVISGNFMIIILDIRWYSDFVLMINWNPFFSCVIGFEWNNWNFDYFLMKISYDLVRKNNFRLQIPGSGSTFQCQVKPPLSNNYVWMIPYHAIVRTFAWFKHDEHVKLPLINYPTKANFSRSPDLS